jgi:hypothetical protein
VDEFAALLDGGRPTADPQLQVLVALAASLRPAPLTPRAEFRSGLRATLVEAAADRVALPRQSSPTAPARPRLPFAAPPARHRLRGVVASVLAMTLVAGAGAALASTRALPGDALYGLKRGLETIQLDLARSAQSKGREYLEQAESRLAEAESLAAADGARSDVSRERISVALTEMQSATAAGAQVLTASYAETGEPESLRLLERFVTAARARLIDLEAILDPPTRARAVSLADALSALLAHLATLLVERTSQAAALGPTAPGALSVAQLARNGWAAGTDAQREVGTGAPTLGPPVDASLDGGSLAGTPAGAGSAGALVPGLSPAAVGGVAGGGGGGGGGGASTTGTTPALPVPTVSLPPVGGGGGGGTAPGPVLPPPGAPVVPPGAPVVSVPPASVPPASVPPASVPPASPPVVSVPPVGVPGGPPVSVPVPPVTGLPCVPVPPATHC